MGVVALPWIWNYLPGWAAAVVVMILLAHRSAVQLSEGEPWRSAAGALSALLALGFAGGWAVAGGWLVPALAVAVCVLIFPKVTGWARPDAIDVAAGAALAGAFAMQPNLLQPERGGWVAPIILMLGFRRLATFLLRTWGRPAPSSSLGAPSRNVRGTLSFSGVVAGSDGLARSIPLDLEIRAGVSLAILGDDGGEGRDLAEALAGRRPPIDGQYCIDGVPPAENEALVAVVGLSEPFLVGGLAENVAALSDVSLDFDQKAAVRDACALSEVEESLKGAAIGEDGRPLDPHHRLMVQLARVVVSHYRLLIVVDPMVSVNPVRSELWRAAVVRASVGRTAVWVTPDRELAQRAERVMVLRHGTLRAFEPQMNGGD